MTTINGYTIGPKANLREANLQGASKVLKEKKNVEG